MVQDHAHQHGTRRPRHPPCVRRTSQVASSPMMGQLGQFLCVNRNCVCECRKRPVSRCFSRTSFPAAEHGCSHRRWVSWAGPATADLVPSDDDGRHTSTLPSSTRVPGALLLLLISQLLMTTSLPIFNVKTRPDPLSHLVATPCSSRCTPPAPPAPTPPVFVIISTRARRPPFWD